MNNSEFRLQKVLDVRALLEKERQKNLAISKRELNDEQTKLNAAEAQKNKFVQNLNKIKQTTVSKIVGHYDYFLSLVHKTNNKRQTVESLEKEVEQKRQSLLEASKDKKMLENLKEKKMRENIKLENKKSQSFIDEIALRKKANH